MRPHRRTMPAPFSAALSALMLTAPALAGIPGAGIGYPDLLARLGKGNVPTGAGVRVAQVEVAIVGAYGPNQGAAQEYAGKNFIEMSGPAGTSTHANTVAKNFYGNATSIAPGVVDIHLYETSHWLGGGFLNITAAPSTPPATPPNGLRIINNSWIADTAITSAVRRADYAAHQFDLLMVNGVANDNLASSNVPLLSHMYNGIAVGKSAGGHQTGDTLEDGVGRQKPEIVAPTPTTSYSAGVVSSVAALMYETADQLTAVAGAPASATRSEVIKAVVLAGAHHRPAWTNNPVTSGPGRGVTDTPLDDDFGVDVVNVDRSHMIMSGGSYPGASSPPSFATADHAGWSLESIELDGSVYWRFIITEVADQVSILTTWHRRVPLGFSTSDVANFDLELWRVGPPNQLESLVGDAGVPHFQSGNVVSNSDVDNIEHLFIRNLQPGSYVLELRRVDAIAAHATWDAAVAWLMPANPCMGDFVSSDTFQPPPDGVVDAADLAALLGQWGPNPGSYADMVSSDTFQPPPDGVVDAADLARLLGNWGTCQ